MKLRMTLIAAGAAAAFAFPAAAQQPAPNPAPPSGQAQQNATPPASAPVPATPADIPVGTRVTGPDGSVVGEVVEADGTGAVLRSTAGQGRLNLDAFTKDSRGIRIGYTSAQFDQLVGGGSGQGGPDETEEPAAEEPAAPAEQPAQPAPATETPE